MLKTTAGEITADIKAIFETVGASASLNQPNGLAVKAPATGEVIATIARDDPASVADKVEKSAVAHEKWAKVSRAEREAFLMALSDAVKAKQEAFSALITYEGGKKPKSASLEVGRSFGVLADYVKSSALPDLELPSGEILEREKVIKPVGVVGVITSYNFPLAVASWNFAPALLAGNSALWKPSEKTPLTAIAYKGVFDQTVKEFNTTHNNIVPSDLLQVVVGEREVGAALVDHEKTDLISATGSTGMGDGIRQAWAKKKNNEHKPVLELGGNNAIVVSDKCDAATLEVAVNAILNSVMMNGGQFCTCTRRLIIHEDVYDTVINKLKDKLETYIGSGAISNPLTGDVAGDNQMYAPLIDRNAFDHVMKKALEAADKEGGTIVFGQKVLKDHNYDEALVKSDQHPENGTYVKPTLVEMPDGAALKQDGIMHKETFAPVLFVTKYKGPIENAVEMVNAPANAGLVNGLYTQSKKEFKAFKQEVESGDIVVNTAIGTVNPMRSGMGFGGHKPHSGQGISLETTADPLSGFGEKEKTRRVTRNRKIELNRE
jgi:aldehyde dehydrogenase (NAD+)